MRIETLLRAGLVAGGLLFGVTANAATCLSLSGANVTVEPSVACETGSGNDPFPGALSAFGFSWTGIEKNDNDDNTGFLSSTGNGTLSGTWSIDPSIYPSPYNQFVLVLKSGPDFVAFLLSGLSGTWSSDSPPALSHMSLYGRLGDDDCCDQDVPEPGSLALLGLGLLGLGLTRRRIAK